MKIGIICPTADEFEPFIKYMSLKVDSVYAKRNIYVGNIEEHHIIALVSGARKVNAAFCTAILIQQFHVDFILLSGIAGGIDRRLDICDIVIADRTTYHDVPGEKLVKHQPGLENHYLYTDNRTVEKARLFLAQKDRLERNGFTANVYIGTITCGDNFVDKDGRDELIAAHQSLCVDMETAAIAQVCFALDVPFFAVRSISDTEKESGRANLSKNLRAASHTSFYVAKEILTHCIVN